MNTAVKLFQNPNSGFAAAVVRAYSSALPKYAALAVSVPSKHVYHVELNRPDKLNTFNQDMWKDLKVCFHALGEEPECRVVVLSARGKLFSAGIDLQSLIQSFSQGSEIEDVARRGRFIYNWVKELGIVGNTSIVRELCYTARKMDAAEALELGLVGKVFPDKDSIDLQSLIQSFSQGSEIEDVARRGRFIYNWVKELGECITSVEDCVKPVLNVVHGGCVGAAVNLITAADIRYCTEDAWFQVKEVAVGIAPDVGVLQRLPKIVGNTSIVRELCYTARKMDAAEALELGLVGKVFPDKDSALSHALSVAESIAAKSPVAVQATKQNIVYSQDKTPREGLEHIALINMLNHQSEDLTKSALAIATKGEAPEFENI